jgi:hypothetical protein
MKKFLPNNGSLLTLESETKSQESLVPRKAKMSMSMVRLQKAASVRLAQPKKVYTEEDIKRKEQERVAKVKAMSTETLTDSWPNLSGKDSSEKLVSMLTMAKMRFGLKRFYAPQLLALRNKRVRVYETKV